MPRLLNRGKILLPTYGTETTEYPGVEEWVGPLPHAIYKNKLICITDLNVRPNNIKLLKENIDMNLCNMN